MLPTSLSGAVMSTSQGKSARMFCSAADVGDFDSVVGASSC
jgi:hypothetical protein